jgi:hypothetical protein
MAVAYDKLRKYGCAIKYFDICQSLNAEMIAAQFGTSFCKLKAGDIHGSLAQVNSTITSIERLIIKERALNRKESCESPVETRSQSDSLESKLVDSLYLKAVLFRLMRRFHEAWQVYRTFRKYCIFEEKRDLIRTTFGFLMLPLSDDRRMIMDYTEKLLKYMKYYECRYSLVPDPMLDRFFDRKERKWNPKKLELALEILSRKPFFKRFTKEQLRPFIQHLEIQQFEVDQMIFVDKKVCIILGGAVECRQNINGHRCSSLIAKF